MLRRFVTVAVSILLGDAPVAGTGAGVTPAVELLPAQGGDGFCCEVEDFALLVLAVFLLLEPGAAAVVTGLDLGFFLGGGSGSAFALAVLEARNSALTSENLEARLVHVS